MKNNNKKLGNKSERLFQFKITLNNSQPRIWRRIIIPANYTFFDLHIAIQDAMGWLDSHLHGFRIAQKGTARSINIQYPNHEADFGIEEDDLDERDEYIADYFGKTIKQCIYDYDFGDSWEHTVLFEKELLSEDKEIYPKCVAGENMCPPEDCGGVWGYKHLQDVLKDPKHDEYEDMVDWLCIEDGNEFNPKDFDCKEVIFIDSKKRLKEYKKGFGI